MSRSIRVTFLPLCVMLASCSTGSRPDTSPIALSDFAHPPAGLVTDVVEMSPEVLGGPTVLIQKEGFRSGDREFVSAEREITSQRADGSTEVDAVTPVIVERSLEPGQSWPVEGLVGQVNGRPVFADAFFEPISDQLLQVAAMRDRVEARRALVEIVRRSFKETVDSELIVAEAESKLSPEQQQGLFAWLRSMQEETIAERGGSRAAAEASLEAEGSQSLEEFMQQRRDIVLARRLLNERIEPRTIVAWRDVQQEYDRREVEFNPPPTMKVGRIRLNTQTEAEVITRVQQAAAAGKTFSQIAADMKLPDGGLWNTFDLPADGLKGLPFSDAYKERLEGLGVDAISAPFEQRGFTMWLAVLAIDSRAERSIFDKSVQLQLQSELKNRREIIERERYLTTLRSRWVTDEIGNMERRLLEIAIERYWR